MYGTYMYDTYSFLHMQMYTCIRIVIYNIQHTVYKYIHMHTYVSDPMCPLYLRLAAYHVQVTLQMTAHIHTYSVVYTYICMYVITSSYHT